MALCIIFVHRTSQVLSHDYEYRKIYWSTSTPTLVVVEYEYRKLYSNTPRYNTMIVISKTALMRKLSFVVSSYTRSYLYEVCQPAFTYSMAL